MNRANYYNYIEEKLHTLAQRITIGGKLNMLALHLHSESFYQHFFNLLYGYNLVNLNQEFQNVEAIDLIDRDEKIVIQVSSTATKAKIEGALDKKSLMDYSDYTFKFISIAKDASSLRKNTYKNPYSINFEPSRDIYDIASLLNEIKDFDIDKLKRVYEFIQKELGESISKLNQNLTTKLGKSTIKGRKKELQEIEEHLNSSKALLIHGIGGIGKSTIASYYLHQHKNKFDYYGFFEGLDDFVNKLEIAFKIKVEQGQDRLTVVLHELTKLDGNKLLVIDNIQEVTENKKTIEKILDLKEHDGFKILLTSREEIDGIDTYLLDTLSMGDAKELFNSIYKVEDEVLLEEVLEYLDCHAFFVEMTAKTLKYKKSLNLTKIKKMFNSGDFYKVGMKRKENFNTYLNKLFNFSALNREEKIILSKLTLLPSIEIDFEFLEKIFKVNNNMGLVEIFFFITSYIKMMFFKGTPIDDIFEENLNSLAEKGWISKTDKGYKLHQITKEYILMNYPPNLIEIHNIITSIHIQKDNNLKIFDEKSMENDLIYMESIILFFAKTGNVNKDTADYYNALGEIYLKKGAYRKAEDFYLKAIEIFNTLRKKYPNIAMSYNGLANIHSLNGEFNKAEEFYDKALKIQEKILGKVDPEIAKTYNYLANYYKVKDEYETSELLYLKALEIQEKVLGELHSNTIESYINLAKLYQHYKENDSAERIYIKILNIRIKAFGQNHLYVAVSCIDLAFFYFENNDLIKAKKYMIIGMEIFKSLLPKNHDYIIKLENILKVIDIKQSMEN